MKKFCRIASIRKYSHQS